MVENFFLRGKIPDLVVQERILRPFPHARRPADDHHRRFLGKCLRGTVGDLQTTDTISDAHCPQPAHASISVGGKSRALFIARVHHPELALFEQIVKTEHVIARDTEHMAHPKRVKSLNQILTNRVQMLHNGLRNVFFYHPQTAEPYKNLITESRSLGAQNRFLLL